MSEHRARIRWKSEGDVTRGRFSREHTWSFDGGMTIAASSSPSAVPLPYSNPANVDPEEAFVAALSSCHMMSFLFLAFRKGFQVAAYDDDAVGVMTKNDRGVLWVSSVELHPVITYAGDKRPTPAEEEDLHHRAHEQCFIAQSVKTEVSVKARGGP